MHILPINCSVLVENSSCELKILLYKELLSLFSVILFCGFLLLIRYLYARFGPRADATPE